MPPLGISDLGSRCCALNQPAAFGARAGMMGSPARGHTVAALTGGLLSSSCCVLQLLLNFLPVGCAGFSVLTPLRPILQTVTIVVLGHMLLRDGMNRRTCATLALALTLMLSQDAVAWYNMGGSSTMLTGSARWLQSRVQVQAQPDGMSPRHAADTRRPSAGAAAEAGQPANSMQDDMAKAKDGSDSGTHATSNGCAGVATAGEATAGGSVPHQDYFHFRMDGLKCEGCALRLKTVLQQSPGVSRCVVNRGTRQVLVWAERGHPQVSAEALVDRIRAVSPTYDVKLEEHLQL